MKNLTLTSVALLTCVFAAVAVKAASHCVGLQNAPQSPQQMKNGCDYDPGTSDPRKYYDPETFEFVTSEDDLPEGSDNPDDPNNNAGNPGNSKIPIGQCSRDEVPARQICDRSQGDLTCTFGQATVTRAVTIHRFPCKPDGTCDEAQPLPKAYFNRPFKDDDCS